MNTVLIGKVIKAVIPIVVKAGKNVFDLHERRENERVQIEADKRNNAIKIVLVAATLIGTIIYNVDKRNNTKGDEVYD